MKECKKAKRLLSAYLDGQASRPDTLFVKQHLEICKPCSKEYNQLCQVKELTVAKKHQKLPEGDFIFSLENEITNQEAKNLPQSISLGSLARRLIFFPAALVILFFFLFFTLGSPDGYVSLEDKILNQESITTDTAARLILGINS